MRLSPRPAFVGVPAAAALLVVLLAVVAPGAIRAAARAGGQAGRRGSAQLPWLTEINYWRKAAGLRPVTDERAWTRGIKSHLVYLEKTPAHYLVGRYASAHTENPASPYYTAAGAQEAASADLAPGGACTATAAIDIWLAAPFHTVGMLRARLTRVAFAVDPSRCYAGLDVIRGLDPLGAAATKPILYPGPGSTTRLVRFGGESPDPTQTCGWQGTQVGLPLIVLLPKAPTKRITATLQGPTGLESTANRQLCVVDEHTFHSSDRVYGPNGAQILRADNAVFLIPLDPLQSGSYSATLRQPGQASISWSFRAQSTATSPG